MTDGIEPDQQNQLNICLLLDVYALFLSFRCPILYNKSPRTLVLMAMKKNFIPSSLFPTNALSKGIIRNKRNRTAKMPTLESITPTYANILSFITQ
jgi:hypothetical protein